MSCSIELEKNEEIPKDLAELKPKRKYVKKVKYVEVDLTPPVESQEPEPEPAKDSVPKEKKPRTDAQKLAFEKCLETKRIKAEERKQQRDEVKEEKLMKAEDKIVKTGIKLQKKALMRLAIEDGDGIEEIPDSVVKAVLKKRATKSQPKPPAQPLQSPLQSPSRKFTFIDN